MKTLIIFLVLIVMTTTPSLSQAITKEAFFPKSVYSLFFSSLVQKDNSFYIGAYVQKLIQIDELNQGVEHYYGLYKSNFEGSIDSLNLIKRSQSFLPFDLENNENNEMEVYYYEKYNLVSKVLTLSRFGINGNEILYKKYENYKIPFSTSYQKITQLNDSIYIPVCDHSMLSVLIIDKDFKSHSLKKIIDVPIDLYNDVDNLMLTKLERGYAYTALLTKGFTTKLLLIITDNSFNIISTTEYNNPYESFYIADVAYFQNRLYCYFLCRPLKNSPTPDKKNYIRVYDDYGEFINEISLLPNVATNNGIMKIDDSGNIFLAYYVFQKTILDGSGQPAYNLWDFGLTRIDCQTNKEKSIHWGRPDVDNIIGNFLVLDNDNVVVAGHQDFNGYLAFVDFSAQGIEDKSPTSLQISPNPAGNYITITLKPSEGFEPSEGSEIHIYNMLGEKVMTVETRRAVPLRINISDLPKGMYFVKAGGETAKFVKL